MLFGKNHVRLVGQVDTSGSEKSSVLLESCMLNFRSTFSVIFIAKSGSYDKMLMTRLDQARQENI